MNEASSSSDISTEKFCPQCGLSCEPLPVPHTSKDCDRCGRHVHFVRRDNEGIRVEKGEQFHIPAGWLNLSLQPKPGSKLFRPGLALLVNQLFANKLPTEKNVREFIEELDAQFGPDVERIAAAHGLRACDEDLEKLLEAVQDKHSRDMYILVTAMTAGGVLWSIENGNAARAAYAAYCLGTYRGLTIVSEPLFEETLWRGYLANEVVYEAAAAAGNRSPAELEALNKLRPLFEQFDEATLHTLVNSGLPIGPKINVKHVPEELLKAFAKYHLATLEKAREEEKQAARDRKEDARQATKDKREAIELRLKWAGIGATFAGIVAGLVIKFG